MKRKKALIAYLALLVKDYPDQREMTRVLKSDMDECLSAIGSAVERSGTVTPITNDARMLPGGKEGR